MEVGHPEVEDQDPGADRPDPVEGLAAGRGLVDGVAGGPEIGGVHHPEVGLVVGQHDRDAHRRPSSLETDPAARTVGVGAAFHDSDCRAFWVGDPTRSGVAPLPHDLGPRDRQVHLGVHQRDQAHRDGVVLAVGGVRLGQLDRVPLDAVHPAELLAGGADDVHVLSDLFGHGLIRHRFVSLVRVSKGVARDVLEIDDGANVEASRVPSAGPHASADLREPRGRHGRDRPRRQGRASGIRQDLQERRPPGPPPTEEVPPADLDVVAVGRVGAQEVMDLGDPVVRHHGEQVVGEVERLAVGEDGGGEQGIDLEDPGVGQVAVVGGIGVMGDLAELHQEGIEGQQRDDPEKPEDRPGVEQVDGRQQAQPVRPAEAAGDAVAVEMAKGPGAGGVGGEVRGLRPAEEVAQDGRRPEPLGNIVEPELRPGHREHSGHRAVQADQVRVAGGVVDELMMTQVGFPVLLGHRHDREHQENVRDQLVGHLVPEQDVVAGIMGEARQPVLGDGHEQGAERREGDEDGGGNPA